MKALIYSLVLFVIPVLTNAGGLAGGDSQAGDVGLYVQSIIDFINAVLFPLALAIAFIFLVWGIVKFFVIGGDSDEGKSKGKDLIIYSLVGFVVIFSFYGLVNLLANGLGFNSDDSIKATVPKAPSIRS